MKLKYPLFIVLSSLYICNIYAKSNFDLTLHPNIGFTFPIQEKWETKIYTTNQDIVYINREKTFEVGYWEIGGLGSYIFDKTRKISLGYQHRFIHTFYEDKLDEKRILVYYRNVYTIRKTKLEGIFKFEPRFQHESFFSNRYEINADIPFVKSENNNRPFYFVLGTEALIFYGKERNTSLDQRFKMGFKKSISKHFVFSAGLQYRLQNYTRIPYHRLIVQMGYNFNL
ncbi:MAG: DUF2490 domain-containing protein [Chitinophagales bacterium]|nr:DUF2490 domain-containing protein [Chitinophagales bacterium]